MDYSLVPDEVTMGLLNGCVLEAERADLVALRLDGLRKSLPESFWGQMMVAAEAIRGSARFLRALLDCSQVHAVRVPLALDHLNILLPCLSRSLRDITAFIEDKSLKRDVRWRRMYHDMMKEAGGVPLAQRFALYHHFLDLMRQMLARDPTFDLNQLDELRDRILDLRQRRGIPPPSPTLPPSPLALREAMGPAYYDKDVHWAEQIFTMPPPSRTALNHRKQSGAYGPFLQMGQTNIPAGSKTLLRRQFDHDAVSLQVVNNSADGSPYVLMRQYTQGNILFSCRGAHELCIQREGSLLQLRRWSQQLQQSKPWADLYFLTWEEMVMFYCTFVALKAHSEQIISMRPDEYKIAGEKRLFQARIIDDRFQHSLIVYQDRETRGLRLHAAVWEGEFRQCPVWTAFVPHQSASAAPWLSRKTKHRFLLKDVQLYVFCGKYRHENMRRNKAGAFELYFASDEAAARFKELFYPYATAESSDNNEPDIAR